MIVYVIVFLAGVVVGVAFTAVQAAKKIRFYETQLSQIRQALSGEGEEGEVL
jgi:type II secretory pathway pseudopilin PulG